MSHIVLDLQAAGIHHGRVSRKAFGQMSAIIECKKRVLLFLAIVSVVALMGCQQAATSAPVAKREPSHNQQQLTAAQDFADFKVKANSGDRLAQYMVGYRYENGDGVEQDYALAAQWYQKAADQGYAAAQYSLGLLYEKNLGVPQDYEKAYFWLSLAASAYSERDGNLRSEVVSARDYAARHLTRTKLLEVQEQTAQFITKHPKSF